jgi:hypothetical protein
MSNRYDENGWEILDAEDCLDFHQGDCKGAVEYRVPMSGTGRSFARCDHHFDVRWAVQERLTRDYGVPLTYDGSDYDSDY